MSATWPASLPDAPDVGGFTETPPDNLLRSSMDVGPAKVRRRYTAGVRTFTANVFLTRDQVATFETFYLSTIASGALPFDWTNPRTGGPATFRLLEAPVYTPDADGVGVNVSLKLEQLP